MTVIVKIEPVYIKLEKGWEANVTGIDMFSGDPYNGNVYNSDSGERKNVRWMSDGKTRDHNGPLDLNMELIELKYVTEAAVKLGAKMYP